MAPRPSASSLRASLRVLHATDIHFLETPSVADVIRSPKRIIGCTNLFLLGRAGRFSRHVQTQLSSAIAEHQPDLVVLSGDTTTLALESEFALARRALHPLLDNDCAFPTLIVPGNHDAYTPDAQRRQLMRKYFGPWMERTEMDGVAEWQWAHSERPARFKEQVERLQQHFVQFDRDAVAPAAASSSAAPASSSGATALPSLPVFALGFLRLLSLNPCRPTAIGSNGLYPHEQLQQLQRLLRDAPQPLPSRSDPWWAETAAACAASSSLPLSSCYNILLGHYPVLDGHGRPYEQQHRFHGVSNGAQLRDLLQQAQNRIKPHMFLHGHVHRGFRDQLPLDAVSASAAHPGAASSPAGGATSAHQMLIFNPGSSGQSYSARSKRCAAFNIYTISQGAQVPPHDLAAARPPSSAPGGPAAAASASTTTLLRPKRAYPAPQAPPPFPQQSASFSSAGADDTASASDTATLSGDRPRGGAGSAGVETIYQPSADGRVKYFVSTERWLHDGQEFRKEPMPYTEGF